MNIVVTLLALFSLSAAAAAENRFLTLSISSSRRLALSSPAAMEGSSSQSPVNPAGFGMFSEAYKPRVRLYFNISGSLTALNDLYRNDEFDDTNDAEKALIAASILFKGISLSNKIIDMGVTLGEQSPQDYHDVRFFKYYPLFDNCHNRAFFRLKLHPKILVGVSAELFTEGRSIEAIGYSYGVILKPGKLNAGVFYYILPKSRESGFLLNDRIANETINAGISWKPAAVIEIFADLRNLSEENQPAYLEPHTGIEISPFKHASFRAGFYQRERKEGIFSFGIGLLNLDDFRARDDISVSRETALEYSVTFLAQDILLHTFSLQIGL